LIQPFSGHEKLPTPLAASANQQPDGRGRILRPLKYYKVYFKKMNTKTPIKNINQSKSMQNFQNNHRRQRSMFQHPNLGNHYPPRSHHPSHLFATRPKRYTLVFQLLKFVVLGTFLSIAKFSKASPATQPRQEHQKPK
jgi:hypothetical protein